MGSVSMKANINFASDNGAEIVQRISGSDDTVGTRLFHGMLNISDAWIIFPTSIVDTTAQDAEVFIVNLGTNAVDIGNSVDGVISSIDNGEIFFCQWSNANGLAFKTSSGTSDIEIGITY